MSDDDRKTLKEKHPNLDFFLANILDASPKDDLGSMEHPMFALKAGDKNIRLYKNGINFMEITPSIKGHATIFDKDILIYCISQLVWAKNQGHEITRTIQVTAHDILVATNRGTGGKDYLALQDSFDRLVGTRVKTNIASGGSTQKRWFGLVESIEIIERSENDKKMMSIEITLSKWLYNSVQANEILTLSRDYFLIRKPLERRLYELARKHCGKQAKWKIGLKKLHLKSGSRGNIREFRRLIKDLSKKNYLPDYSFSYDEDLDQVVARLRTL